MSTGVRSRGEPHLEKENKPLDLPEIYRSGTHRPYPGTGKNGTHGGNAHTPQRRTGRCGALEPGRGYLGQYVGSRLPHERTDRRLPLDFAERRLAALVLLPAAAPRARRGGASQIGYGPEMAGRVGAVARFSTLENDANSQRKLKSSPSTFAFFLGGGDDDVDGGEPRGRPSSLTSDSSSSSRVKSSSS